MRGANGIELQRYFRQPETAFGKSVQRSWQFFGMFIYNPFSNETKFAANNVGIFGGNTNLVKSINKDFPPIIQPFHILDVTIPTYQFERVNMMYGQVPRSFPVLKFEGFEFTVNLEEDEQGTVEYFINWLQRRVIDNKGYYNAPEKVKIPAFVLEVQDKMGIPNVYYTFHDIYFLQASEANYSYTGNESIKRSITFGCDRMSTVFIKQNAVAAGIGIAVGAKNSVKNDLKDLSGILQKRSSR